MEKAILIYNPFSGNRIIIKKLDYIIQRFQQNNILLQPFRIFDHIQEQLVPIIQDGNFDFIFIAGGDGTLNTISNLLLKHNIDLPIGVIPTGTCNDFARCIDISNDLDKTLARFFKRKVVKLDVGLIDNEQYFLSSCAGGLFVSASFSTKDELKKNFGPLAYYLKGLTQMTNIKSFRLKITTDTEVIEEEVLLFVILNGKHVAGFYNLVYDALMDDGFMDIVLIRKCNQIELANLFFKLMSNNFSADKNVINIRTQKCRIESQQEIVLSIDGEKGKLLPIEVEYLQRYLQVLV
jgi:diacylglycerol kinase (ATP)